MLKCSWTKQIGRLKKKKTAWTCPQGKFEINFALFFLSEVFHTIWEKIRNNHQCLERKDDEFATEIVSVSPKVQKEKQREESDGYSR